VDMDLAPFARINPCGMAGLAVTSLAQLGVSMSVEAAGREFARHFEQRLAASSQAA
jgi:lipoyl(octanoyl) transferase